MITSQTPIRGELAPGVDCYILGPAPDDHRVSKRAVVTALTPGAKHGNSERYVKRIPAPILAAVGLYTPEPNIVEIPIPGATAHTYSATDFVKILTAYTKWLASGKMRKDQEHLGRNAAGMLATFAAVGVVTAIQQACGHLSKHTEQTKAELAKINSDMEVMRHEQALILAYQRQILASQTRAHEAKTAPAPAPAPEPAQPQAPIPSNNDPEMDRLITIVRKHLPPPGETVSNLDVASWISPGKKRQLDQALDTILFLLVHDGTLQLQRAWTNRRGRLGMMYRVGSSKHVHGPVIN